MKIKNAVAAILLGTVFSMTATPADGGALSESAPTEQLAQLVAGSSGPELSGLQVAVFKAGTLVYSKAFGVAGHDERGAEVPLRQDHKIRAASISKLVAAIGVMRLADEGKISLSDEAEKYLPIRLRNPNYPDEKITIEHLLAHISSVRDNKRYWLSYKNDLSSFFPEAGSETQILGGDHYAPAGNERPGHWFRYSNLGFGLLAGVIETASGKRFDRYMRDEIFEPLGLKISYSPCDITRNNPADLASPFRRLDAEGNWDIKANWQEQVDASALRCFYGMPLTVRDKAFDVGEELLADYKLASNPTMFSPQGGLRASAADLAQIMVLLQRGGSLNGVKILEPDTVANMLRSRWKYNPKDINGITTEAPELEAEYGGLMAEYGLSVHIAHLKDWGITTEDRTLYGHLAEAHGLLGQAWLDPQTGDGFVALITGTGDDPAKYPGRTSPLFAPEEDILRWWLANF